MNELIYTPTPREEIEQLWKLAADFQYDEERLEDSRRILKRLRYLADRYDFGESYEHQAYRMRCIGMLFLECELLDEAYIAIEKALEFYDLECSDLELSFVVSMLEAKVRIEIFRGDKTSALKTLFLFHELAEREKYTPDVWKRIGEGLGVRIKEMNNWKTDEHRREHFTCEICKEIRENTELREYPLDGKSRRVCWRCYSRAYRQVHPEEYEDV